jgi:hypothetical protein
MGLRAYTGGFSRQEQGKATRSKARQCKATESKAVRVFGLLPVGFPLLTEEPFGLLLTNQEFLAWLCSKQKSK